MKPVVVINAQHKILPAQHEQIVGFCKGFNAALGEYDLLQVPAAGWTLREQQQQAAALKSAGAVIFVSPLPVMIGTLARRYTVPVYVFHNDLLEKVEKSDGTVFYKVPESGWQLVGV